MSDDVSASEFDALFDEVSNWTRWGDESPRGTLNYLPPDRIVAAASLVRSGITVSLGLTLNANDGPDNPQPAEHRMTQLPDDGSGNVRFVKDSIGIDFHNDGHSHIDALCHVSFHGSLFGGASDSSVGTSGATLGDVEVLQDGIVGRGVLLDVARLRGVSWLEPGDQVLPAEMLDAEQAQSTRIEAGDILLVRTGHTRRLRELGPWDTPQSKAGLHPATVRLLAQRQVAALGSDTNGDAAPSRTQGVPFPIHVLAVNAMGLYLLDYLDLDAVAATCEQLERWEFLCVIAPLRIPGGTGSPINPIAIF